MALKTTNGRKVRNITLETKFNKANSIKQGWKIGTLGTLNRKDTTIGKYSGFTVSGGSFMRKVKRIHDSHLASPHVTGMSKLPKRRLGIINSLRLVLTNVFKCVEIYFTNSDAASQTFDARMFKTIGSRDSKFSVARTTALEAFICGLLAFTYVLLMVY